MMQDTSITDSKRARCSWAESNELFIPYHDKEWGVSVHDDRQLFEMLNLEGAQAGLSWLTILKKRDNYRQAFDNFNANKIASYDDSKRSELLNNDGIVRNKLKINATIENAKAFLKIQKQFTSFDNYIWQFVNDKQFSASDHKEAALVSEKMSKDMKKRGFRFVGPTICYSFMQAVGLINDHDHGCFRSTAP